MAVLSAQVDDLTKTLAAAQKTASISVETLTQLTERAEQTSRRIELQIASIHDIPDAPVVEKTVSSAIKQNPSEPMFTRRAAGAK